jgi:hypothetical protein
MGLAIERNEKLFERCLTLCGRKSLPHSQAVYSDGVTHTGGFCGEGESLILFSPMGEYLADVKYVVKRVNGKFMF